VVTLTTTTIQHITLYLCTNLTFMASDTSCKQHRRICWWPHPCMLSVDS
jgi:hypothetical protein